LNLLNICISRYTHERCAMERYAREDVQGRCRSVVGGETDR
jgi:hypothetical protein